jgi:hypothetical protein
MAALNDAITKTMTSAPSRMPKAAGLVGIRGGARVKMLQAGTHEVLLPMPQLTEAQIPVSWAITATPQAAGKEFRLRQRDGSNVVITVKLAGTPDQEIQMEWSALILIAEKPGSSDTSAPAPDPYKAASGCAQAGAATVKTLAEKLWPADGDLATYAANIQHQVRGMKQTKPLRSMDAVGILDCGMNGICTANANLALALLRAKDIPARSIAVIPPIGQRLEMHRIVAWFDRGGWHQFDPSFLQNDIPLKTWQNIIVAQTTPGDERLAMQPRMGSAIGCPYGQELELLDRGVTLWGNDFFWTIGKPLAEFAASEEAVSLARKEWTRFLATGKSSRGQIEAAGATTSDGLLAALRKN